MNTKRYEEVSYVLRFGGKGAPDGEWLIMDRARGSIYSDNDEAVVFRYPYNADENGPRPPKAVRDEYERLIEWKPGDHTSPPVNIVEACSGEATDGFNQPCKFGYLVTDHAVYCHNTGWLYSPRKCRRTWYTGGETRDEDCEGFEPRMT